jgi:phage shock protein PspC (stress-responsive transcriptional regulator)
MTDALKTLRDLKKSSKGKKIAGVCAGLGEYTPIPAWLWRAIFLTMIFVTGIGIIAYIILWICMPSEDACQ